MIEEIWKDIPEYPGFQVSNYSRIKRLARERQLKHSTKTLKERIMSMTIVNGYYSSVITVDKEEIALRCHRIAAQVFIPNPDNKPEVNHLDGDKLNCYIGNLEWSTKSENMNHAYKLGLKLPIKGIQHGHSKLKEEDVIKIRELCKTMKGKDIAILYKISHAVVSEIKNRKLWNHI